MELYTFYIMNIYIPFLLSLSKRLQETKKVKKKG